MRYALLPLLALAACGGKGAPSAAPPTVRDSAGIRIVENTGPQWPEGAGWTVADSPSVSIGGSAGDPVTDMSQIAGVVRLPDGRLAVANGIGPDVRFFDAEGRHLLTTGRRGSGPGEFQSLAGLLSFGGDSLIATDLMTRRLTVIGSDGAAGRSYTLGAKGGMEIVGGGTGQGSVSLAIPMGAFPEGTVLGMVQAFRVGAAPPGAYRDSAAYVSFSPEGAAGDTAMRLPGVEMEQMTIRFAGQEIFTPSPVPLGRMTAVTVAAGRIADALNDRYEIELRDASGRLVSLVRVAQAAAPITEQDQAAHRQEQLELFRNAPGVAAMPQVFKDQMEQRVKEAKYPATYPFVAELRFDPNGNLWAEEVQQAGITARRYAVFDSAGTLLGRVTMPDRFRPFWIGRDAVAGVWKDADDVEIVRVYQLSRGQ